MCKLPEAKVSDWEIKQRENIVNNHTPIPLLRNLVQERVPYFMRDNLLVAKDEE
jgi:hypothetical protein